MPPQISKGENLRSTSLPDKAKDPGGSQELVGGNQVSSSSWQPDPTAWAELGPAFRAWARGVLPKAQGLKCPSKKNQNLPISFSKSHIFPLY